MIFVNLCNHSLLMNHLQCSWPNRQLALVLNKSHNDQSVDCHYLDLSWQHSVKIMVSVDRSLDRRNFNNCMAFDGLVD